MSMDLEMAEILKVFFEESAEGLDVMESGLLALEADSDRETINTIFRAAHSIKGGAGTFGFAQIAEFTHAVETLLDQMRTGARAVAPDAVQVLLQAVDVMREMLELAQADRPVVSSNADALTRRLTEILAGGPAAAPPGSGPSSAGAAAGTATGAVSGTAVGGASGTAGGAGSGSGGTGGVGSGAIAPAGDIAVRQWRIRFEPHSSLFKTCNDPLPMFSQLEALGALKVEASIERLPTLDALDPTACYLAWMLEVTGPIEQPQLAEVFDWVDANSTVLYECLDESAGTLRTHAHDEAAAPHAAGTSAALRPELGVEPAPPVSAAPSRKTHGGAAPPAAAAVAPPAGAMQPSVAKAPVESGSIRVATEKVDALINLVGELVITQSMLGRFSEEIAPCDLESLRRGLASLARNTRELQESVLKIRMLPISFSFNRFPRLVHELSRKLGKKVELKLSGEGTELDKIVLEKIGDPLVHLVRNSLDHGIETPAARRAAGKPETGVLELDAYHEGGNIIIEVRDDGAGLNKVKILAKARERGLIAADASLSDEQIYNLIFLPGFSTADQVSDVSGRGVGMDVVRRNIMDLGGHVQISSTPGEGSTIRIRLPLTLAILEGQMVRVGKEIYVISLMSIIETVQPSREQIHTIAGRSELLKHREEYLPIIRLHELFDIEPDSREVADGLLIVAESDGQRAALLVDDLLAQQQVVIKSLDTNFRSVPGLAGATIHGDGSVALILDMPSVIGEALAPTQRSSGRVAA